MELRNKRTGDVFDSDQGYLEVTRRSIVIRLDAALPLSATKEFCYGSLDKLYAEWEDYIPKEPLIKDEKIRKAIRAWAEASGITKVLSYGDYFWIGFRSVNTESVWKFECSYSDASEFELDKEYTIAELCGEEEE